MKAGGARRFILSPPLPADDEPLQDGTAIASWEVDYVVTTSVDRYDISDGGAMLFTRWHCASRCAALAAAHGHALPAAASRVALSPCALPARYAAYCCACRSSYSSHRSLYRRPDEGLELPDTRRWGIPHPLRSRAPRQRM